MWIINDWHAVFESAESRRWKKLSWVSIPNTHIGRGYRRLMRQPGGVEAFGCFVLLVQVASRMPRRGVLLDAKGPLTALDLEDLTFVPRSTFEAAITLLSAPEIQWITDVHEVPENFDATERTAMTRAASKTTRAASRAASLPDNSVAPEQMALSPGENEITQGEYAFAQGSPEQTGSGPGFKTHVTERNVTVRSERPPSTVEIRETLARLAQDPEAEAEAEAGFPTPKKRRPSRDDVTRMAQCFRTYAQHVTRSVWKLPDWRMATEAAKLAHGHYAEAESMLKASALAKVPRGAPAVEMRSYALPLKILADHFQNRSTEPPEHL